MRQRYARYEARTGRIFRSPWSTGERMTYRSLVRPCSMGTGAYGTSASLAVSTPVASLLDRGMGYAVCHARGGGEKGDAWHSAGRALSKKQSIADFVACAGA